MISIIFEMRWTRRRIDDDDADADDGDDDDDDGDDDDVDVDVDGDNDEDDDDVDWACERQQLCFCWWNYECFVWDGWHTKTSTRASSLPDLSGQRFQHIPGCLLGRKMWTYLGSV